MTSCPRSSPGLVRSPWRAFGVTLPSTGKTTKHRCNFWSFLPHVRKEYFLDLLTCPFVLSSVLAARATPNFVCPFHTCPFFLMVLSAPSILAFPYHPPPSQDLPRAQPGPGAVTYYGPALGPDLPCVYGPGSSPSCFSFPLCRTMVMIFTLLLHRSIVSIN